MNSPPPATRRRRVLLTPGPVNVHERVREAAACVDVGHREPEALKALQRVREAATTVFGGGTEHATIVLTGSGTAALEAVLSSVVPRRGHVLVLENGRFGQRIGHIVATHGLAHTVVSTPWNEPFDVDRLERLVERNPEITHLAFVHHETSTGILNPAGEIARAAASCGIRVIVDATSSLGSERLDIAADCIDWCVASSNKCLEALPGLSLVCGTKDGFANLPNGATFYLDLHRHWLSQEVLREPLFTPAVQLIFALDTALEILLAEGVEMRRRRYTSLAERLRSALLGRGGRFPVRDINRSSSMTVWQLPAGVSSVDVRQNVREFGFVIYGAPQVFGEACGVATMGQLSAQEVDDFVGVLDSALRA